MDAIVEAVKALSGSVAGIIVIAGVVVETFIAGASVVVKATKTQKDDESLGKFIQLMRKIGLYT